MGFKIDQASNKFTVKLSISLRIWIANPGYVSSIRLETLISIRTEQKDKRKKLPLLANLGFK